MKPFFFDFLLRMFDIAHIPPDKIIWRHLFLVHQSVKSGQQFEWEHVDSKQKMRKTEKKNETRDFEDQHGQRDTREHINE